MESSEVEDRKPIIPTGDIPDKALPVVSGVGKVKQTRYEDVWPEDVHAAFMEAAALYPPMGKRRLKYYRLPTNDNESLADTNRAKSFGRCQLIQSYILEKTGKSRSRKQVSSHLQRLKKIHKDNPAMYVLFLERSQPSPEHPGRSTATVSSVSDIFANIPFSTRHLKSEPEPSVNLQNTDASGNVSAFSDALDSEAPYHSSNSALDLSTNFHDQAFVLLPEDFPQYTAGNTHTSDGDGFPEPQDQLSSKDALNRGFRVGSAFNTPAFSISMCRLASRLAIQDRPFELSPTTQFSRVAHSPAYQPTHQWISRDGSMDDVSYGPSLAPAQQTLHMPFYPIQAIPTEKQQLELGFGSDWMWPHDPDIPLSIREDTFSEVRVRYPQLSCHYDPPISSPATYSSPPESEVPRLSRGVSYPYATSPTTPLDSKNVSKESGTDFPEYQLRESPENFASPLLIKPTPVYPTSYIHPRIY